MATVDPRITPLIETLIASGADSIAVEILVAIQRGQVDEDTADELREAREAVSDFRDGKRTREFKSRETNVHFLTGDEQIEFAAQYVSERFARDIEMADASIELLDKIANGAEDSSSRGAVNPSTVILQWSGIEGSIDRKKLEEVNATLPALRGALSAWSASARGEGKSE